MSRPFVIDACAFKAFYEDVISGTVGDGQKLFELIFRSDWILIDEGGRIRQEWHDCSCGDDDEFFSSWLVQKIAEDRIRFAPNSIDQTLRAKLRNFGMPNKDCKYFHVAALNKACAIVSEDSDMYDPHAKDWSHKRKRNLMETGRSPVARYMRRQFSVCVCPLNKAPHHFS